MWHTVVQFVETYLANNQFASGGLILMALGFMAHYCRAIPTWIASQMKAQLFIELDVSDRDQAFFWIDQWLSGIAYGKRSRLLTVSSKRCESGKRPAIILSPAPGQHYFFYHGRLVSLNRNRTRTQGTGATQSQYESNPSGKLSAGVAFRHNSLQEEFTIRVFTRNRALAQQLITEARDLVLPEEDNRVLIYQRRYEDWRVSGNVKPRALGSVVLAEGAMESLVQDITRFYVRKGWYSERGVPYRRGYLIYGKPGNGKSSLVMALASHFMCNIATISLSRMGMTDDELNEAIAELPEKSILLIEDIDCVFRGREGIGAPLSSVTFSGLLNALDGVASGEGHLLIMTTNHPEMLDPALVRPGRADVHVLVGDPDESQLRRMFLRFFPGEESLAEQFAKEAPKDVCMAAIQGHLLCHAEDPEEAARTASEIQQPSPQEEILDNA